MPMDPNTDLPYGATHLPSASPKRPNAFVRFVKKLFALIIVGAILTLTWMLLSERNSRLFKLERGEGQVLFVLQGRQLPTGFMRWHPDDQQLAQTYAPFVLSEEVLSGLRGDEVYKDRDELDRALFELHLKSVEMLLGREDNSSVEEMVRLLQRAARFGGTTEMQKAQLKEKMAQSSFLEGRLRLLEAGEKLRAALAKLRSASENDDAHYGAKAYQLLARIRTPALAILQVTQSPKLDGGDEATPEPKTHEAQMATPGKHAPNSTGDALPSETDSVAHDPEPNAAPASEADVAPVPEPSTNAPVELPVEQ